MVRVRGEGGEELCAFRACYAMLRGRRRKKTSAAEDGRIEKLAAQ